MAKLTIAAVILVLAATMSLTEAQNIPSCASSLTPCASYLNTNTTPGTDCCNAIKDAVANQLTCLCNLYNDPEVLKLFNISLPAALQLSRNCGVNNSLSGCANALSPTGSVPPPPGQAGSDGAADRIVWTGVTSLLLFLAFAVLF
ncbi:hypothetical protein SLEP1_g8838 [Rubroshorea leprosula]|uniref:Bifunctional inhibitor/plant lipid transfer protein/seed storage helical domain-containing protein n=1 Tax=Rubroshorea leprosula TaxID=152421 RepID=A0AAV5ICS5_9ROSI|nr:hypothetical protein SLEP1_g8838 [Rubroshorea leprosula]